MSTEQIIQEFRNYLRATKSSNTKNLYSIAVKQFLEFIDGNLDKINSQTIEQWIQHLKQQGYKPNTIITKKRAVDNFIDWLKNHKKPDVQRTKVALPRPQDPNRIVLTKEELQHVLQTIVDNFTGLGRICLIFLAATGVRVSELIKIKVDDISIVNGRVVVRVVGKGGKFRTVPAFKFLNPYLKEHLLRFRPTYWLFPSTHAPGHHITFRAVQKYCERLSKILGRRIHPHAFRYTYASIQYARGVDIVTLRRILGHSKLQTTELYISQSPDGLVEKIEKNDGL